MPGLIVVEQRLSVSEAIRRLVACFANDEVAGRVTWPEDPASSNENQ